MNYKYFLYLLICYLAHNYGSVADIIETNGPWLLNYCSVLLFFCLYQIKENSKLNNMVFVDFALLFMDLK